MKKRFITCSALLCMSLAALSGCWKKNTDETVLTLRNLYFSSWDGSDPYTDVIEEKFGVSIEPSSYDYNSWGEQVSSEVNGNNIGDVFHFDLESFNFGNTYLTWAEGGIIKALPKDLSKWPKIKHLIDNTSNIDALKLDGKIYGLPLAYNQNDPDKVFSSFTYVYRRDWLKKTNPELVHEDDVYSWNEFLNIIDVFAARDEVAAGNAAAIGDVSWGFPSLTNFFKDSPHCYSLRNNKVVNTFTTNEYIEGLNVTRNYTATKKYFDQISNTNNTKSYDAYKSGSMGIYYENLSLNNYTTLRKDIKGLNPGITDEALNDRTAIMKVKGPDNKFHLESSENWFSMTFFNADMSDAKMEKILDILDYLLGEEGTRLAIYGKQNQDYILNDGEVELIADSWTVNPSTGEYATKNNGAKFLREMITLNYDTTEIDPFTDQKSYRILKKWQDDMKYAKDHNQLVIFGEPGNIKWLSTNLKDANTSFLIKEGNDNALRYCYSNGADDYSSEAKYKEKFNTNIWTSTLAEVNRALGL